MILFCQPDTTLTMWIKVPGQWTWKAMLVQVTLHFKTCHSVVTRASMHFFSKSNTIITGKLLSTVTRNSHQLCCDLYIHHVCTYPIYLHIQLARAITETGELQDLWLASWKPGRRANGVLLAWVWVQRQEETIVPAPRQSGWVNFPLLCLFVLFRLSVGWVNPTHNEEDNLCYLVYWFKCLCHPETPS